MGEHAMLPPPEVLSTFKSKEEPSKFPSGQDTSFSNPTEIPFRFTEGSMDVRKTMSPTKKPDNPNYMTTAQEVGKLDAVETDMPMRWYGRNGQFTSSWVAESKTMTRSGLGTAIDRSDVHPT